MGQNVGKFMMELSPSKGYPTDDTVGGDKFLPEIVHDKIAKLLAGGERSIRSIARMCGVSYGTVRHQLKTNPQLAKMYDDAWHETMERVEESMLSLIENSENDVAREKMIEFALKYRRADVYSDTASTLNAVSEGGGRIVLAPVLPVMKVDSEGKPITEVNPNDNAIDAEVIEKNGEEATNSR